MECVQYLVRCEACDGRSVQCGEVECSAVITNKETVCSL